MSVKLRQKKNTKYISQYLDIYHKGKREFYFLDECRLEFGNSPQIKNQNKEARTLATTIRDKVALEIASETFDINKYKQSNIDLMPIYNNYCESYNKKDKRVVLASYRKFKEYLDDNNIKSLTTKKLNESLIYDYKDYLELNLKGETPSNYFKKFKMFIKYCIRNKIITENLTDGIRVKKNDSIKKAILTFDEVLLIMNTKCNNELIKDAFVFSCYTGLRFCDIKGLKGSNINNDRITLIQQKTGVKVIIPLNSITKKILDKYLNKDGIIFNLPSHTTCNKVLKKLVIESNINKLITWHCARHTFGTGIITHGSDMNSAKELLGHSSFAYTQKYVRESEKLKEKAVNNLPTFFDENKD
jgi:site-specific recombinase XerD